jgi:ATP-dependent Zn protease
MFWLAIGFMMVFLFNIFQQGSQSSGGAAGKAEQIAYSDFMAEAKSGRISDVTIKGLDVNAYL